ncbi:hypothetical protein [Streptomyces sp. NPDC006193]|uniref:hypothetical protein n=1 Tax=Streptomyces sp. NPDC006193 TaxID=3155717 RepID=UPI0033BA0F77
MPAGGEPADPPPPPASARFPDAPPSTGRAPRRAGTAPAAPPRPDAPPRRSAPSAKTADTGSGATARPRPVPPAPAAPASSSPGRPATAPAGPDDRRTGAAPAAAVHGDPAGHASSTGGPAAQPRPAPAWTPAAPAHPASPLPDPAHNWSAAPAARPAVHFAAPETFDERTASPARRRTAAAAACLVLGVGLLSGAVTGSWLTGDDGHEAARSAFSTAGTLWHTVPVDELFPPTVQGSGAGPGGADRTWTRIAVAPDSGCAHAFDPLLRRVLAPVGCRRLLRATYTDATETHVTTVGLLFTDADPAAMSALAARFRDERLDRRADLMPRPYAARGTAAAEFGDRQRASWTLSVLTDAPVVAYAVSGWADGRTVDSPQPAADAVRSGATAAPAQAGLGNEAQGLADRIERRLRRTVGTATEKPS